jgi:hypothetical protein
MVSASGLAGISAAVDGLSDDGGSSGAEDEQAASVVAAAKAAIRLRRRDGFLFMTTPLWIEIE